MNKHQLFNSILLVSILVSAVYLLGFRTMSPSKLAYMDVPKAFEQFDMKKALQEKLSQELQSKNRVLDSLKINMANLPKNSPAELAIVAAKRNELVQVTESYSRMHQQSVEEYDKQILNRLNKYVREYANQKGYDFILGAEGSGAIMAANESLDITDDIIEFANLKYQGE